MRSRLQLRGLLEMTNKVGWSHIVVNLAASGWNACSEMPLMLPRNTDLVQITSRSVDRACITAAERQVHMIAARAGHRRLVPLAQTGAPAVAGAPSSASGTAPSTRTGFRASLVLGLEPLLRELSLWVRCHRHKRCKHCHTRR